MPSFLTAALALVLVAAAPGTALAPQDRPGRAKVESAMQDAWRRDRSGPPRRREPAASQRPVWSEGQRLPRAYRGGVVRDHARYGLYAPPRGHVWVRVGDDAYLTGPGGRVVEVLRDSY